jgi:hypothetical protein
MEVFRLGDRLHEKPFLSSSGETLQTKRTGVGWIIHLIVSLRDAWGKCEDWLVVNSFDEVPQDDVPGEYWDKEE